MKLSNDDDDDVLGYISPFVILWKNTYEVFMLMNVKKKKKICANIQYLPRLVSVEASDIKSIFFSIYSVVTQIIFGLCKLLSIFYHTVACTVGDFCEITQDLLGCHGLGFWFRCFLFYFVDNIIGCRVVLHFLSLSFSCLFFHFQCNTACVSPHCWFVRV